MKLPALLNSWNKPDFDALLLQALKQLDVDQLPLKQVANFSGVFAQDTLQFSLQNKHENEQHLIMKLGIFYQEITNLCPCSGDEPDTMEGYCEIQMMVDKSDGSIDFTIV